MNTKEQAEQFLQNFYSTVTPAILDNPGELEALIERTYHKPFTVLKGSELSALNSNDILGNYQAGLKDLVDCGWAYTTTSRLDTLVLHSELAMITRCYSRHKADDSIMESSGATYIVIKVEDQWRIAQVIMHGPDDRLTSS